MKKAHMFAYLLVIVLAVIPGLLSCSNKGGSLPFFPLPDQGPDKPVPIAGQVIVEFSRSYADANNADAIVSDLNEFLDYRYEITSVEPLTGDPSASTSVMPSIFSLAGEYPARAAALPSADVPALYVVYINNVSDRETAEIKNILKGFTGIQNVTSDYTIAVNMGDETLATANPDYPYRAAHYAGWNMDMIQLAQANGFTTGSGDVKVAVIDTGVSCGNSSFASVCEAGYDFVNNDSDPTDDGSHGTHVAGIIAAQDTGNGVKGVAPGVKIIPIKLINSGRFIVLSNAIRSINFAVSQGADIINMSWTYTPEDEDEFLALRKAIEMARDADVLLTIAAGNSLYPQADLPARYDTENIISVAWTDINDKLGDIRDVKPGGGGSNYNPVSVDLSAPGEDVYSTGPDNSYFYGTGTSMAAPHVAGVAALIKSLEPGLTYSEIKNIILSSVDSSPSLDGMVLTGGRVNAYKAVSLTMNGNANLENLTISAGMLSPSFSQNVPGYTVMVNESVNQISLTPFAAGHESILTVNGQPASTGQQYGPINLDFGLNTITIGVLAHDGSTAKTYTLSITRGEPYLENLTITPGTLVPSFNQNVPGYTVTVNESVSQISLTPFAGDPESVLSVNGQPASTGQQYGPIDLDFGANTITIGVSSHDGTMSKTYTLTVTREEPDLVKIVLTSNKSGNYEVYSVYDDASYERNLSNNTGNGLAGTSFDGYAAWSPDGSKIAFMSGRLLETHHTLYVINANGTGLTQVTNTDYKCSGRPDWSPDGTQLVFAADYDEEGALNLYRGAADGSSIVKITTDYSDKYNPRWSPDGTTIVYDDNIHVYSVGANGTGQQDLTDTAGGISQEPLWSPDGTKILFQSNRDSNWEIYVMNADGSAETNLTNNASLDCSPNWSPDGTRISFASERYSSTRNIFIMNANGSGVNRLTSVTTTLYRCDVPQWAPDGSAIYYTYYTFSSRLRAVNPDGTNDRQVLTYILDSDFGYSLWK